MKVSVIIPVYNVEKYLRRCLDSVVNQTYKDIEVILVNDGSPDNSKKICEEYVAKYSNIQLINQKNAGLGAARNTGLQYITGNAVTFVDSDDWLELDAIEYYVASMKKSDADIVVTQMIRKKEYFSNEGTNGTTIKEEVLNQEQFAKKYFKIDGNNIEYYACAKLYKREIAREVKYPVGLFAEDVPAAFGYIIRSQKIFYSTKVTYNYFFNDNSLTAKFTDKDFDLEKIWDLVVEEAKVYGNEDYILYAKVNRYRIDFNLLCRIALSENKSDIEKYSQEIVVLLGKVKENKKILLKYLPFSRKVIFRLFIVDYTLGRNVLRMFKNIV
ncbi:glycosyl transferase family protein [Streptococcus pneumoniae]|uniref:glycosyltransferase family 2 protein n=1 Tax=Streptococcus pneumoniae TaxID=1313 RepID=UPI0005DF9D23|nr:glycosyltransferase family 2 protein [Streptococcus pneumoniae]CEX91832.1 glycosyl transferase family protein [Streptococcus pneumoniae]CJA28488.1 glycosyl transferase family protein [Streptococcus pneumoniae]CJF31081.1 glycosyl transferase family protein [Streptococcus pneumoniae]COD56588.1 glycosyl transferase family protein [Streptococcus pneumoniae]COL49845.1 glycosyl transferase family protein [Streptococcus pneumoniae]